MKNFTITKASASGLWEEAEILGIVSKPHHSEYISKYHSCPSGKDVYLTHEKATKALRMRSNRARSKEVYKCHICGHYHLTSRDGESRRPHAYSRSREKVHVQQTREFVSDNEIMERARTMRSKKIQLQSYWLSKHRDLKLALAI